MGKRSRTRMTGLSESDRVKRSHKRKAKEEELRRKIQQERAAQALDRVITMFPSVNSPIFCRDKDLPDNVRIVKEFTGNANKKKS